MSSNPFKLDFLNPKPEGVPGAGGTTSGSTPINPADKESLILQGVNILQQTNAGCMATTDGVFENYDGFTRSGGSGNSDAQKEASLRMKGNSASNEGKAAQKSAGSARSAADGAREDALDITKSQVKLGNNVVTKGNQAITKMTTLNANIDNAEQENDILSSQVLSIETEIADLVAEDGGSYTPSFVPPTPVIQPGSGNSQGTSDGQSGGGQEPTASTLSVSPTGGGNAGGDNGFAMLSLPSSNQTYAPTSITAVAASRNNNPGTGAPVTGANGGNGTPQPSKSSAQQPGKSSTPAGGNGNNPPAGSPNPLEAYVGSLPTPEGGKNADKIEELQNESQSLQGQINGNSSDMFNWQSTLTSVFNNANAYGKSAAKASAVAQQQAQDDQAKGTNAIKVGQWTSTVGGVVSATGATMIAFMPTVVPGAVVSAVGTGTSVVGSVTTTAGQTAQGDSQGALNTTQTTTAQAVNTMQNIKAAMDANPKK